MEKTMLKGLHNASAICNLLNRTGKFEAKCKVETKPIEDLSSFLGIGELTKGCMQIFHNQSINGEEVRTAGLYESEGTIDVRSGKDMPWITLNYHYSNVAYSEDGWRGRMSPNLEDKTLLETDADTGEVEDIMCALLAAYGGWVQEDGKYWEVRPVQKYIPMLAELMLTQ